MIRACASEMRSRGAAARGDYGRGSRQSVGEDVGASEGELRLHRTRSVPSIRAPRRQPTRRAST